VYQLPATATADLSVGQLLLLLSAWPVRQEEENSVALLHSKDNSSKVSKRRK
jgi:hypothetical protein